jgi:hypothetical protein
MANRVVHSRRNRPELRPGSKPEFGFSFVVGETEFRKSALIAAGFFVNRDWWSSNSMLWVRGAADVWNSISSTTKEKPNSGLDPGLDFGRFRLLCTTLMPSGTH